MPASFLKCERSPHHKTFTIKPNKHTLIHVCKNTSTGKTYTGEVHHLSGGHMVGKPRKARATTTISHKTTARTPRMKKARSF